jgi:hypothetical protein
LQHLFKEQFLVLYGHHRTEQIAGSAAWKQVLAVLRPVSFDAASLRHAFRVSITVPVACGWRTSRAAVVNQGISHDVHIFQGGIGTAPLTLSISLLLQRSTT